VRRLSGPFGPRSSHRPVLPPIRSEGRSIALTNAAFHADLAGGWRSFRRDLAAVLPRRDADSLATCRLITT
jgi:hypothetical protein